ncbi:Man1-Src1p-C-terminal domain-containing protein [Syncephalis fuscata]|nr:Man1-Src1p-C-terminal domain-containing protein [Syncephalis fuscata]
MEDTSYLEPDFDPSKLKVADLRRVLLAHEVKAPSTAKKQQLVDLFLSDIKPRANELLQQQMNVKASGVGITLVGGARNVSRSQSTNSNISTENETEPTVAATPVRRGGKGRAARFVGSDADDEASAVKPSRAKGGRARREVVKQDSLLLTDDEAQVFSTPTTRPRGRAKKQAQPIETPVAPKQEEPLDNVDNVLTSATKARSTKRRIGQPRKSAAALVASVVEPLADPTSPERDVEMVQEAARVKNRAIADATARAISSKKPQHNTSDLPVTLSQLLSNEEEVMANSATRRRGGRESHGSGYFSDDNPFQSGTEDASDERLIRRRVEASKPATKKTHLKPKEDLDNSPFYDPFTATPAPHERQTSGRERRTPIAQKVVKNPRPSLSTASFSWFSLVIVVMGFSLAANLVWYRHQKMQLGYCDTGVVPPESKHSGLFGILQEPTCILCPFHATCKDRQLEGCASGYLLQEHPLQQCWPFSATCVPDTKREVRVHELVQKSLQIIAERTGLIECGALKGLGHLSLTQLRDIVQQLDIGKSMSSTQFDDAWSEATQELTSHADELALTIAKDDTNNTVNVSSKAPIYPLSCRIQRGVTQLLLSYLPELIGIILVLSGYWYIRSWMQTKSQDSTLATAMVDHALDILYQQEHRHHTDPTQHPYAAVSITHLRDLLLRDIHDLQRRQRIWTRVQNIVEKNSNIRTSVQELRGEQTRTWTWVGTVTSPAKKPSGRSVYPSLDN